MILHGRHNSDRKRGHSLNCSFDNVIIANIFYILMAGVLASVGGLALQKGSKE